MEQLAFKFDVPIELVKKAPKRVHYTSTPSRAKVYEFWHINPLTNEKQYNGDEKHIFRIKVLQRIHGIIYSYFVDNPFVNEGVEIANVREILNQVQNDSKVICHHEDKQAEIDGTWQLSIKERLLLHIELLRELRGK